MSEMNVFILNALFFYMLSWIYNIRNNKDIILTIYKSQLSLDDDSLADNIKEFDNEMLKIELSKIGDSSFDEVVDLLQKIDEKEKKHRMMDCDKEYQKSLVSEYKREIRFYYVTRKLKSSIVIFLRDLYVLIPVLILVFTGSLFMPLMASIVIMTLFAIKREDDVYESIEHYHGEEVANKSSVRVSVFLTVLLEALLKQWYIYAYIIFRAIF